MRLADAPGTIALPTHEMGRFLLFTISLAGTNQPPGCYLNASASASVTENLNKIMGDVKTERPDDAWVWIMGDDHCWNSMALVDMLRTMDRHPEIDVLVPLVTKRNPPWHLVVFDEVGQHSEDGTPMFKPIPWERVPSEGVFEVDAAGSAGMLIRRHVIDAMEQPIFYSTLDSGGRQVVLNEDVTFCTRIRHEHGFRIFATSDVALGHLGIFNVRPMHNGERWGALTEFSSMDDKFKHVFMPLEEEEPVGV
jgi:hypothetical protein